VYAEIRFPEQKRLVLALDLAHGEPHLWEEPHVGHLVGFIDYDHFHLVDL
jgi:hypothetical protein